MTMLLRTCERWSRPLALFVALLATMVCPDWRVLLCGWLALWILLWTVGLGATHGSFVGRLWLPLGAAIVVVWGVIVGAPPGQLVGSDPGGGFTYGSVVALRLVIFSGLGQLLFLAVPAPELASALRQYGVPADIVVIVVSARILIAELTLRVDQIWTARLARGVVRSRNRLEYLRHFPYLLRPLFTWILRSAIQRSELWTSRGLLASFDSNSANAFIPSRGRSAWYMALASGWALVCVYARLRGAAY